MAYSTLEERLEAWRKVILVGGPAWMADCAPEIVRQLEAEIAAQVGRHPEGQDPSSGLGERSE
jgi:hypothetical protein